MVQIITKTGAHVNLKELLEFNKDLIKFKKTLDNYFEEINQSVKQLEQGWKDEKLLEYKEQFQHYTDILKPLGEELETSRIFMETHWVPKIEKHLNMKPKSN